jgi:hypothetical protein
MLCKIILTFRKSVPSPAKRWQSDNWGSLRVSWTSKPCPFQTWGRRGGVGGRVFDETLFRIFAKHETRENAPVFRETFASFASFTKRNFVKNPSGWGWLPSPPTASTKLSPNPPPHVHSKYTTHNTQPSYSPTPLPTTHIVNTLPTPSSRPPHIYFTHVHPTYMYFTHVLHQSHIPTPYPPHQKHQPLPLLRPGPLLQPTPLPKTPRTPTFCRRLRKVINHYIKVMQGPENSQPICWK